MVETKPSSAISSASASTLNSFSMSSSSIYDYFFKGIGFIYFSSFFSIYIQYRGLLSHNGLLPVDAFITKIKKYRSIPSHHSNIKEFLKNFVEFPSLAVFASDIGVSIDGIMEMMLIVGCIASCLIFLGVHNWKW